MIGHFTAIANDNSDAIGCALSRYQEGGYKKHYLVCNYGYTNMVGQPVYSVGKSASECELKHPLFKGLCTT